MAEDKLKISDFKFPRSRFGTGRVSGFPEVNSGTGQILSSRFKVQSLFNALIIIWSSEIMHAFNIAPRLPLGRHYW